MRSSREYSIDPPHQAADDPKRMMLSTDQVLEALSVIANYAEVCQMIARTSEFTNRSEVAAWLSIIGDQAHVVAASVRAGYVAAEPVRPLPAIENRAEHFREAQ